MKYKKIVYRSIQQQNLQQDLLEDTAHNDKTTNQNKFNDNLIKINLATRFGRYLNRIKYMHSTIFCQRFFISKKKSFHVVRLKTT